MDLDHDKQIRIVVYVLVGAPLVSAIVLGITSSLLSYIFGGF
jgi:hypothetical protein